MVRTVLDVATVQGEAVIIAQSFVLLTVVLGEAPFLRDEDLLTAGVLELGTTQCLNHLGLEAIARTHRHDGLADVHAGNGALGFAESTTHSSLKPVCVWRKVGLEFGRFKGFV
jgi:hypothetical protein